MTIKISNNTYKAIKIISIVAFILALITLGLTIIFSSSTKAEASSSASSSFNVNVAESISLTLSDCDETGSPSDSVNLSIMPTSAGTFKSACQRVLVSTNTPGYELLVKANSSHPDYNSGAETNALLYQNPTDTTPLPVIQATSATIDSPAVISNNTWGFAVKGLGNFDADYELNNSSNAFANLPFDSDAQIYSTDQWPLPRKEFDFYYGSKLTLATVAGTYKTQVTYTAIGEEVTPLPLMFKQISAGFTHTCAVVYNNNAYCWGTNSSGELGNNTLGANSDIPVPVSKPTNGLEELTIKQVSAGFSSTCVIASDNNVYCWGSNAYGQIGNGNTGTNSNVPVAVSKLSGGLEGLTIKQLSMGYDHVCVIASDNNVYCWGRNNYGQLGNSNTGTDSNIPVLVSKLPGGLEGLSVEQISTGADHVCVIASDNNAYCWGRNNYGQLGNSNTGTDSNVPVLVSKLPGGLEGLSIEQVSAYNGHTCVIASDKNAYCWGYNYFGQLGDGKTRTSSNIPVPVVKLSGGLADLTIEKISTGTCFTCVIASDKNAYCWGMNTYGQLGDGTTSDKNVPTPVVKFSGGLKDLTIKQISTDSSFTCAVASDDKAYCWGYNAQGQLGDGTNTNKRVPVKVVD